MNSLAKTVMGVVLGLMLVLPALAQDAKTAPKAKTLFTNVHVFDGKTENRFMNANVLVEGNMIKAVSTDPIEADFLEGQILNAAQITELEEEHGGEDGKCSDEHEHAADQGVGEGRQGIAAAVIDIGKTGGGRPIRR